MACGTMESIDNQLYTLDQKISELIDPNTLQNELAARHSITSKDLNELQAKDNELVKELSKLQRLWMLSNLIKEIEVNLELFEFETVFYSFDKLKQKVNNELEDKSIISDKVYELDTAIIESLTNVWNQLLHITNESITYNAEVEIEGTLILFESIHEVINSNKLSARLQSNLSHIIDQKLLSSLTNDQSTLRLEDNTIEIIKSSSEPSISDQLQSVKNLILFIQQFPTSDTLIHYIQTRLFEWLKHLLTINIENVYGNVELQSQFKDLGIFLNEQGLKKNDLIKWIDLELNNIVIEYYLNTHIDKIRKLFSSVDKSIFTNILTKEADIPQLRSETIQKKTEPQNQANEDEWGWRDTDVDFNSDNEDLPEHGAGKAEEDDDWDAWNDDQDKESKEDDGWDAWEGQEEKVQSKSKSKSKKILVSKLSKAKGSRTPTPTPAPAPTNAVQVTKIPDQIIAIFKSYLATNTKLPSKFHDEHHSKLNYLATTYYILSLDFFEQEPVLLYNDLSYVLSSYQIPRLSELTENLLLTTIELYENELSNTFKQLRGLDASLNSLNTFKVLDALQLELNDIIKNLSKLSNFETFNKVLISVVDQFYQNVIDAILIKPSIGEDESEYLNIIIAKILELKIQGFENLKKVIKNYTKLIHINFILSNHMSEIMQQFYDAVFFDLETNELISLIDKLFADSDLKRRNIEEIREIRETF